MFGEAGHAEADGKRASPGHIEGVARSIDPVCLESPQYETEVLGGKLGLRLVCKAETATPIRSYKSRGTAYLLQRLEGEEGRLVCASAGNLGQGLAHAARKRNVLLMMFAAQSANPPRYFDGAKAAAHSPYFGRVREMVLRRGRAGDGDRGRGRYDRARAVRWPEPFGALLAPPGSGALLSGVGTWIKAHAPSTEVIGVCAEEASAMAFSLREGVAKTTERLDTIADGIAVGVPAEETLSDLAGTVGDIFPVGDGAMV